MRGRIKYNVMSEQELALFKERMELLLEKRGVHMTHQAMKAALEKAGCPVEGDRVRFPKEIIKKAVAAVPEQFVLYAPDEDHNMTFPHPEGGFYTRTCTGAPQYLPAEGEKHPVNLEDTAQWFHLVNAMDNVDFVALPSTCSEEIPGTVIDVYTLEQALKISKKHIWIQPYEGANTKYLIDMCAAAAGGLDKLREKPIVSFISCSVPVLKFKDMDAEILYQCAMAGIPVQPCALPTAGANTPITAQGTALAACADVLAQIVMLELLCPGLPVIATPLLFSMDMQTTYTLQSNTEITFGRLLCMQAFEQGYGIPCHSYGTGTDSMTLDAQNMIERTSLIHAMALSDASVLGGAGQLETAKTISPLQLIIDNEIFGIARRLRSGLEVNDETMDFEELLEGDDEDGYIMSEHTLEYFGGIHRPELFYRGHLNTVEDGANNLESHARRVYEQVMRQPAEPVLTPEREAAVHEVLLAAHKALA